MTYQMLLLSSSTAAQLQQLCQLPGAQLNPDEKSALCQALKNAWSLSPDDISGLQALGAPATWPTERKVVDPVPRPQTLEPFVMPDTPESFPYTIGTATGVVYWPVRFSNRQIALVFIEGRNSSHHASGGVADFLAKFIQERFPQGVPAELCEQGLQVALKERFDDKSVQYVLVPVNMWDPFQAVYNFDSRAHMARHIGVTENSLAQATRLRHLKARAVPSIRKERS